MTCHDAEAFVFPDQLAEVVDGYRLVLFAPQPTFQEPRAVAKPQLVAVGGTRQFDLGKE